VPYTNLPGATTSCHNPNTCAAVAIKACDGNFNGAVHPHYAQLSGNYFKYDGGCGPTSGRPPFRMEPKTSTPAIYFYFKGYGQLTGWAFGTSCAGSGLTAISDYSSQ
jgi:hypothetical protein